jgi:PAP2 superfamily
MTELALAFGQRSWTGLKLLWLSFTAQWFMMVIPIVYLFTNFLLFERLPHHGVVLMMAVTIGVLLFGLPVGLFAILFVRLASYLESGKRPSHELFREVADLIQNPSRIINAIPLIVALMFFNKALLELKIEIPVLHPFDWDVYFSNLDRQLHFGVDPWVVLQPLMGFDIVTTICNIFYGFWFFVMFGALLWFGFQKQASELRTRFFLAYMLLWFVGGGLMALEFSSAGPAFYGQLGLPHDPYIGLNKYLLELNGRIPVWSVSAQKLLWDGYTHIRQPIGISAFPSMHNGTAFLIAIAFRPVSKTLSNVLFGFAAVIFLSSIHLGWHYAVDGYASFGLALLCWWGARPAASFFHQTELMKRFNTELTMIKSNE